MVLLRCHQSADPSLQTLSTNPIYSMTEGGLYRHDISHTHTNLYVLLNVTLRTC